MPGLKPEPAYSLQRGPSDTRRDVQIVPDIFFLAHQNGIGLGLHLPGLTITLQSVRAWFDYEAIGSPHI